MKKIVTLVIITISLVHSNAQKTLVPVGFIDSLSVSDIKTTHLILEENIKYLDIGSPYFVVDTLPKIIKLKHTGEELLNPISQHSNLTIITQNGRYHSIDLSYKRAPELLTYRVNKSIVTIDHIQEKIKAEHKLKADNNILCNKVELALPTIKIDKEKDGLKINVDGIYYYKDQLIIRVELSNTSAITIDLDQVLFRSELKKKFRKDFVYQENIFTPVKVCGGGLRVIGGEKHKMIYVFEKFTLAEKERLEINFIEYNGGRAVSVFVPKDKLLNPITIKN